MQLEENVVVYCLVVCVCSTPRPGPKERQGPAPKSPLYLETDRGFKIERVTTCAIFTKFGTQKFLPRFAP